MADCIFCKIIAKQIPSKFVYEDDLVVAFEDINPQAPVHTLIIPKKHIPTLLDMEEEDYQIIAHLFKVAKNVAREKGIADRGFRLLTNCNPEGGQIVYHLHFHLMGGRQMRSPFG
ncbi:MAG: histidine triad nucleotide-binding protein [Thermodesulfovibrionales bacterium]|nr:histidine triad nucleotide-binding protein [Thermodesulfovibrionales bacterium]